MAAPTIVQSVGTAHSGAVSTLVATLPSTPTDGNTLFAIITRSFGDASNSFELDSSWTQLSGDDVDWPSYGYIRLYTKSATGASANATATQTGSYLGARLTMAVYETDGSLVSWLLTEADSSYSTTQSIGSVTPPNGDDVLLLAMQVVGHAQTLSSGPSGYSTAVNVYASSGGASNRNLGFYKQVTGASGSYGGTATYAAIVKADTYHLVIGSSVTPTVDFIGSPNPANIDETITFTDLSIGNPTDWSWDFGDGNTSTSQNPTHSYGTAGAYSVTLTASNAAGTGTKTRAQYIIVLAGAEPGIWIDWAGDGFDDGSGYADPDSARLARMLPQANAVGTASGGDNVTAYVMRADWFRGGSYDHVGGNGPGGFTLVLDNSDGRFDPENTASPLYGYIQPGLAVWGGAITTTGALSGAGTVGGFLAGYIREFVPTVDATGKRVVEVIGQDAFGEMYQRAVVSVPPSLSRSHGTLRGLILDAAGEDSDRRDMESETGMMPFSAVETESALSVLEELNTATASRHVIIPADSKEAFYYYTVVNKLHKLQSAADASLTGDDIHDVSGWRVTSDNVIEVQRVQVNPVSVTPAATVVWDYPDVPLVVTQSASKTIIAEFDDYVFEAEADYNTTTGTPQVDFQSYGKRAFITLYATTSTPVTFGQLRILGQQVERADTIVVESGVSDAGARAGTTISSDFVGQVGAAQGLCDFLTWKYGQPLKRPAIEVKGRDATTYGFIFTRDVYDVITLTVTKLSVTTARRLEIVGLRGSLVPGKEWSVTYELQETPNQSAVDWFDVNLDNVNGPKFIAPF